MVVSMGETELSRLSVLMDIEVGRLRIDDAVGLLQLQRRQVFRLLVETARWRISRPDVRRGASRACIDVANLEAQSKTYAPDHLAAESWSVRIGIGKTCVIGLPT
jgi:hypothetical protein